MQGGLHLSASNTYVPYQPQQFVESHSSVVKHKKARHKERNIAMPTPRTSSFFSQKYWFELFTGQGQTSSSRSAKGRKVLHSVRNYNNYPSVGVHENAEQHEFRSDGDEYDEIPSPEERTTVPSQPVAVNNQDMWMANVGNGNVGKGMYEIFNSISSSVFPFNPTTAQQLHIDMQRLAFAVAKKEKQQLKKEHDISHRIITFTSALQENPHGDALSRKQYNKDMQDLEQQLQCTITEWKQYLISHGRQDQVGTELLELANAVVNSKIAYAIIDGHIKKLATNRSPESDHCAQEHHSYQHGS